MRRILILTLTLLVCVPVFAQEKSAEPKPREITPDQLWTALLAGNRIYVTGAVSYNLLKEERTQTAGGQSPPITIVGCSDSRVPPELIFNQSLGILFVVRSAGNVVDDFGLASIEFAIAKGYTKLIVVLGHNSCGAVLASLGGADGGSPALNELAARIRSSFIGVTYDPGNPANVQKAVEMNARAAAASLLARSKIIRDAALTEKIKIVTANYDMATGEVKQID
ncbi:MAG TPA: carbonic anhydrase [Thermoanaerobaculia bacterium]|nr:carbonic anhydrase [Thermoanaerobaculia bacterium]